MTVPLPVHRANATGNLTDCDLPAQPVLLLCQPGVMLSVWWWSACSVAAVSVQGVVLVVVGVGWWVCSGPAAVTFPHCVRLLRRVLLASVVDGRVGCVIARGVPDA